MGGIFGVASKENCMFDLFFGVDYHSHLGTKCGGIAVYGKNGFTQAVHSIEHAPFRTEFDKEFGEFEGNIGIGCISDNEPQPLIVRSHLGSYAITTVGLVTNVDELAEKLFESGAFHFLELSGGAINQTELIASLINQKSTFIEGVQYAQSVIKGSVTMLIMTAEGIYACRDKMGRTPLIIGKKRNAFCASFESFAFLNIGYKEFKELGPGEIDFITSEGVQVLVAPAKEMKICSFLWMYYGYPTSTYEGVGVESARYKTGEIMSKDDDVDVDIVAGVPDSGTPHAIGYANAKGIPFARPFIKYTPTWPRSFMPTKQTQRNLIAKMKLIPVDELIRNKKLLLIDDSIVRGTQLGETTDFLYSSGAKEVHIRTACPPIIFGCKYLNFSRLNSENDLITRKVIVAKEGKAEIDKELLYEYADFRSEKYKEMCEEIRKQLNFTTLKYNNADDMAKAIGIEPCKLCTYCFTGRE
ncbi:MAG: amidophosphoribosyltransferase [Lachnospiraceae bacterium]|nr:amidophosphoribosyltransferase [Lachnospiraceae bacterium]